MSPPKHLYDRPALKALGINYSRQHLDRLEREKKIPRSYQRGPHCRKLYSDEHIAILLGRPAGPEAA